MTYDFKEIFALYKGRIKQSNLETIMDHLEKFVSTDKTDFISIIDPNSKAFFVYEKNFSFDFKETEVSAKAIAKLIIGKELPVISKIDKQIVQFVTENSFSPFDVQISLLFHVQFPGEKQRTLLSR